MRYAHIYSRLLSTPWFVDETTLSAITQLLQSRINGEHVARSRIHVRADDMPGETPEEDPLCRMRVIDGVALIPVFGVIGKHLSAMETMCGGCDMDMVRSLFDAAMANSAVRAVVLNFDSPGGTAIGCHELFTHMFESKSKPLYAFTDATCGSAAYYLACAADAIFTAPTARIGSVGTMLVVRDDSKMLKDQGVKFTIFKSGEFKGLGHPSQPLSEKEAQIFQDMVDTLGAQFRADVSRSRPRIARADMEGLAYLGRAAVAKHFADATVLDVQTLITTIVAGRL